MRNPDISPLSLSANIRPGLLRNLVFLGLVMGVCATLAPVSATGEEPRRLKIVFEMTNGEEAEFDAFVSDIEGLRKHSGTLADITVVVSFQGVSLLRTKNNSFDKRLAKLADQGVDFVACEGSLKKAGMEATDFLGFVRTVKSGGEEVERLEQQGWARVRNGESYVSHL